MNLSRLSHQVLATYYRWRMRDFAYANKNLEAVQRNQLQEILKALSFTDLGRERGYNKVKTYEDFRETFTVSHYSDWRNYVDRQRNSSRDLLCAEVHRYEPTSGSTFERKWIPYSQSFLDELNAAASVWLGDLYKQYPLIQKGRHFWSISWVPEDLRGLIDSKDTGLFPWWQKSLLESMMVMNPAIQKAPTSDSAWWATVLVLGGASDLSFISVWSPTYLLKVMQTLYENRVEIADHLRKGSWGRFQTELASFELPRRRDFPIDLDKKLFVRKVWPQLALVSCWTSSTSSLFASELNEWLSDVPIQGKGLWATEGVVSIPWQNKFPLAIQSHFLEFKNIETDEILPSWKIKTGMILQPLLTTSSGFIRYALPDRVKVTGFVDQNPTVEFLGRMGGTDLVGEKMDYAQAEEIVNKVRAVFGLNRACLVAFSSKQVTQYQLAFIGSLGSDSKERVRVMSDEVENSLSHYHHYRVAREMGQLQAAVVLPFADEDSWSLYTQKSRVLGQNKPEVLVQRNI